MGAAERHKACAVQEDYRLVWVGPWKDPQREARLAVQASASWCSPGLVSVSPFLLAGVNNGLLIP